MYIYEYTKPGFNGGTDKTDKKVQWIASPYKRLADIHVPNDWTYWGMVMQMPPHATDKELKDEGCDFVVRSVLVKL